MTECPYCAEAMPSGADACPHCGETIGRRRGQPAGADLPWVRASVVVLIVCGIAYLLLGVGSVALMGYVGLNPRASSDPDLGESVLVGVAMLGICFVFGVFNLIAAWGLSKRTKWGWICGLVVGALYAPSICFPFGFVLLYGLLRADARETLGLSAG